MGEVHCNIQNCHNIVIGYIQYVQAESSAGQAWLLKCSKRRDMCYMVKRGCAELPG